LQPNELWPGSPYSWYSCPNSPDMCYVVRLEIKYVELKPGLILWLD